MRSTLSRRHWMPLLGSLALLLLSGGCAVGPNFKRPAAPQGAGYTTAPLPDTLPGNTHTDVGAAQRFVQGSDVAGDWWTLFHSTPLNELIEQSLANNPDLKAAQAALAVARENVLAQRGAYYPSVTAGFAASRQRQSGQIAPTPNSNIFLYNLFTPQVSVSYVPDVFGLNRRTVESLRRRQQEARFQMIATYNTLTSNVVVAAIQESLARAADRRDPPADRGQHQASLEILQYQLAKGYASRLDVAAQESQLAQVAATLPPLLKQLAQLHDLLAVLAGRFPSQAPAEKLRAGEPAVAAGPAGQPALGAGRAASGRAARRRRTCTTPAPRSASPSPTACRTSS